MTATRAKTGNYYYGARYYDPKVSLWLSVDPMANEFPYISPYNFVENNPIMLIDPDGRSATCPTCPDGPEFDEARNSIFDYTYDEETGEATMNETTDGGELEEVTLLNPGTNHNPLDNTSVASQNGFLTNSKATQDNSGGFWDWLTPEPLSVEERTSQANAINKWLAKNVNQEAMNDLSVLAPTVPSADNEYAHYIEGITEWFSLDYKPSGDSVIMVDKHGKATVNAVLKPGGGISPFSRDNPPTSKDSSKFRIVGPGAK
jgi:RHS repeat-associated protein